MIGDVVSVKKDIFDIRKESEGPMASLTAGVEGFINKHQFYPSVFYNENDINDPIRGVRAAIKDLDIYAGIFVHQDAPDTPIAGFQGIEFRSSISKSIREYTGAKQLLWTVQDLTNLQPLAPPVYDPDPSVQFCGTVVFMQNGEPFPQQAPRLKSVMSTGTCGLHTQMNVKYQMFRDGAFVEVGGKNLPQDGYWRLMQDHTYGLSVRGWGNWDYRFYEMLASGRIPVHIHTDDELLFERDLPWDDMIVIVDNLNEIKDKVEAFHSQFTDDAALRRHTKWLVSTYHEWLSFPAFCRRFETYYEEEINKWL